MAYDTAINNEAAIAELLKTNELMMLTRKQLKTKDNKSIIYF
jgi:hypothetical protein